MTKGREHDVAAIDGLLEPDDVSTEVLNGIRNKSFLILPHRNVYKYIKNKVDDYDRWISGMQKLKQKIEQLK